jgi:hypothetical protein
MPPEDSELWFDAMAKTGTEVEGIKSSFAGGNGGQEGVQPMIDEELMETPAAVWSYGGCEVVAGQWEAQTHTVEMGIWIPREPIDVAYREAIAFVDRVMAAFPPRAKARLSVPRVQSAVITRIAAPVPRTWPEDSPSQYIVLPVIFEVKVSGYRNYQPA